MWTNERKGQFLFGLQNVISIDWKKEEYKRWVRPNEWLSMPKMKDNEIWILLKREGAVSLSGAAYNPTGSTSVQIGWGDGSEIFEVNPVYNEKYNYWSCDFNGVSHEYTTSGYRWLKIIAAEPEKWHFSLYDISSPLFPCVNCEIFVGKDIGRDNNNYTPLYLSGQSVAPEHFVTPIHTVPQSCTSLGNLYGCRCLEINECDEDLSFSSYGFSGEIFEVPPNVKRLQTVGSGMLEYSSVRYIYGENVREINKFMQGGSYYGNALEKVDFPKLEAINYFAFAEMQTFKEFDFSTVKTLSERAFYSTSISSIDTLNCTYIPSECFSCCYRLTSVSLQSVTNVGRNAFSVCRGLKNVYMPNCERLESGVFSGCYALRELTVKAGCTFGADAVPYWVKINYF